MMRRNFLTAMAGMAAASSVVPNSMGSVISEQSPKKKIYYVVSDRKPQFS